MLPFDPVVLTGIGLRHALGDSWETWGENLLQGLQGIRSLSQHPVLSEHPSKARMFSWLDDISAPKTIPVEKFHFLSGLSRLGLVCAEDAWEMSGITEKDYSPGEIGVVMGSGLGNLRDLDPVYNLYFTQGPRNLSPLTLPVNMANGLSNTVSRGLGAQGPSWTVSTACASGMSAVLQARDLLRTGGAQVVLAGGADLSICPTLIDAWEKMRILSPETQNPQRACRPMDKSRTGLVLGEGGAVFVLETLSGAQKRGASILGVLKGGSTNCDAWDLVAPREETQVACLQQGLKDAKITPSEVDLVHIHGTGTQKNDHQELEVLSQVFGRDLEKLSLAAIKSQTAHTMGASGVFSLAAALYSLKNKVHFTQGNLENPDWEGPLKLPGLREPFTGTRVMVNSFAFGGTNVSIILEKDENHG